MPCVMFGQASDKCTHVEIHECGGSIGGCPVVDTLYNCEDARSGTRVLVISFYISAMACLVSICTRILKYRVWKIKFDELGFLSSLNQDFTACVACKIRVWNRQNRGQYPFVSADITSGHNYLYFGHLGQNYH